jgi:tRNA threonylcarbamoyladenosine biosynthesis protein TsaE
MILENEGATEQLGTELAAVLRPGDVIALSGPLGVGKTSLTRSILRALGHEGDVPSPSFAIVQPYEDLDPPVWHVDLFRIDQARELEELGLDSAADSVLIIEWPERAGESAWPDALRLTLEFDREGARRLTASLPPAWQERWRPQ